MSLDSAAYFLNVLEDGLKTPNIGAQSPLCSLDAVLKETTDASSGRPSTTHKRSVDPSLSDELALQQFREGDKEALGILFRRYARMVRAVAFRILRDASEADDLLQEVFLFIFRKWELFDAARGSARSWIIQVTYHRAIDRRRHLSSRRFYAAVDLDDPAAAALGTEIAFYERSLEGTLGKAMVQGIEESLSPDQRETLRLHFFEGYTIEEIAQKMGQTPGNVRNHYYRALEKMRKLIFSPKLPPK